MLQWVTRRKWLPEISATATLMIVAFLTDWQLNGLTAGILGAFLATSVFFFRKFTYLAPAIIGVGFLAEIPLRLGLIASGGLVPVVVLLLAIFAPRRWSLTALAVAMATGIAVIANFAFTLPLYAHVYGMTLTDPTGRLSLFLLRTFTVLGINAAAWFLGGFIAERSQLTGVSRELDAVVTIQARSALDVAEQNQRFVIARDLNDLLLQQTSAIISLTDGARYGSKVDPAVAIRMLDRLDGLLRNLHAEMRRLYDMLNGSLRVAAAPPGIADLDRLAVDLRQLGYNITVKHLGERVVLLPSAELNIYRIVFEAVANVRQHAPMGTDIDVLFTWNDQGLQVLVKDNGTETVNRALASQGKPVVAYEAEEDLDALTQAADGPTIGGMRERAALFQGSVEARRVPGVGFTVNAIFPGVYEFAATQAV